MRTSLQALHALLVGSLVLGCGKGGSNGASPPRETAAANGPARCVPVDNVQLSNVPLEPQETSAWCWAASAQMVLASLTPPVIADQCNLANEQFGQNSCCPPTAAASECLSGGWPQYEPYGYTPAITRDQALDWDEVKTQLGCRGEPFAFSWHWVRGGGHMMVATGYKTDGADRFVCANDPLPVGKGEAYCDTYEEYVSGTNHTHWDDYYKLEKNK